MLKTFKGRDELDTLKECINGFQPLTMSPDHLGLVVSVFCAQKSTNMIDKVLKRTNRNQDVINKSILAIARREFCTAYEVCVPVHLSTTILFVFICALIWVNLWITI